MREGPRSLAWLDFASWDRERALDVIAQLREKETRDELGLGVIRDAFSDRLFPGTSTLQTRARYFLFVPWMYQHLERRRAPSAEIANRARRHELRLCTVLQENGEVDGVIGRVAGQHLKRLPSSIYWLGLEAWGIKVDSSAQSEYHRTIDRWYARETQTERVLRGDEAEQRRLGKWDPRIPAPPADFPDGATFALEEQEAQYLHDKVGARHTSSLLFRMLAHKAGVETVEWPWEWSGLSAAPQDLRIWVSHAQNFSTTMEGASLLYNLLLAELRGDRGEPDYFRDALESWGARMDERRDALDGWDLEDFRRHVDTMSLARGGLTRRFVDAWIALALERDAEDIVDAKDARELVRGREVSLKGSMARTSGGRALELWSGGSGLGAFNYRWHKVKTIVEDIRQALGKEA